MVYHFILLSDESDDFVLEVEAHGQNTFYELHETISQALGFDKHYLASFIRTDNDWNPITEATLIDMDNSGSLLMEDLLIEEWCKTKGHRFIYLFDYVSERGLFMKLVNIKPTIETRSSYPKIIKLTGEIPPQIKQERFIDDLLNTFSKN